MCNIWTWILEDFWYEISAQSNNIPHLPADAFRSTGLVNLHNLLLKDCNITDIDPDAFSGLGILIELDLTKNRIHTLHPGIFRDLIRVRYIYLNHNLLLKLEAGLFTNLIYLQTVEVSHCQLSHISPNTFINVTTLATLKLEGNRESNNIPHLPADAFRSTGLVNLHNLLLKDCNITDIDPDAFSGLGILIELDLTKNRIHTLHPDSPNDTTLPSTSSP
ncbi:reticulon-4 receptor-like [Diaphorina citri]|uniref:Reticulon-4 receptor-like n=1 Tax=Diaphorina citri TaxID=121845 RepID=A0A1S4E9X2_DIACI|nr:reticulon-4 receptor-like [Diaphorina citri]